jgi:hypothetical protein
MTTGSRHPRAGLALLVALGLAETALSYDAGRPHGIVFRHYALLAVIGGWWVVFALAAWLALRLPRRGVLVVVLGFAVLIRLAALNPKAPLSDDLYRYAWDGRVQTHGIDPYRYPPAAPQLAALRVAWLFPHPAACGPPVKVGCSRINRATVRTIYPPVAEAWFTVLAEVIPLSARDRGYEAAGMLVDLAVLAALLALLRDLGRDPRWAVLYAWGPLPVLESATDGHVDALGVLLLLGAVALSLRRRWAAAGAVVGLAFLVKLYPALVLPFVGRLRRAVPAFLAVAVLAYLPHVATVGLRVIGYLPGYLQEEDYGTGSRFLLLDLLGLSGRPADAVAALVVVAAVGWLLWRRTPLVEAATTAFGVFFLVATPVQTWYALVLVALATMCGRWQWLAVGAAGYPYYFRVIIGSPQGAAWVGQLSYGLALLVVLAAAWAQRNGAVANPATPSAKSTSARNPSISPARAGEATT